ncbi:hypothetical protein OB955_17375 [Halobacteria archaeon AArc-m2/3/4]|uniref:Uncharacterized protein n=1 Tax=Natronoglomus mannanivorans TaxID=2979990 RepID=A0ABT2QHY6_9EURY|nr:hypothetical protein [Halobacteria archaeon AArc-m2/3/4]
MEFRQRLVVACLWTAVAVVLGLTLEPALPSTLDQVARLFVVALALFLAAVYLLDPKGLISERGFH